MYNNTEPEEDVVIDSIEIVAQNLSEQVANLKGFLSDLQTVRAKTILNGKEGKQE